VLGIPVRRLHPEWCAAEAFTRELFGEERLALAEGLVFSLDGTFDGSGRPQRAFVGAYRRCAGEQGLFLAIVEPVHEPSRERPRVRFLLEVPEPGSAFAALGREPDGTLAAWWCVACDNGNRIVFNRETHGFYVAGPATRR
jgi:hypothetical protein